MKTLVLWLLTGLVSLFLAEDEAKPVQTYEVWISQQEIRAHPYSFSRVVARPNKGVSLEILEEKEVWARVRVAPDGTEGWTILHAPPQRAGSRQELLEGQASPSSLAIAVKQFKKFAEDVAELLPDVEKRFEALRDSSLEPSDLEEFSAPAGLRLPGQGGSR